MITALGLALAGVGAALVWSGITGEKLSEVALGLATGQPPPAAPAAPAPGQPAVTLTPAGTPGPSAKPMVV